MVEEVRREEAKETLRRKICRTGSLMVKRVGGAGGGKKSTSLLTSSDEVSHNERDWSRSWDFGKAWRWIWQEKDAKVDMHVQMKHREQKLGAKNSIGLEAVQIAGIVGEV